MKIAVLAGSYDQFRTWLHKQPEMDRPYYHYVGKKEDALGLEFQGSREVGTYYEHPEYPDLYDLVRTRIR